MNNDVEHPLSETPQAHRRSFLSILSVISSVTFFIGITFAGGDIGVAFDIKETLWIILAGSILLAIYVACLGAIGAKSGLNTILMARFCFGNVGSRLSDFVLGFAEIGWYGWGVATISSSIISIFSLPTTFMPYLIVLFGLCFCISAMVGTKGLDLLGRLFIPIMLLILLMSIVVATSHAGGWQPITQIAPTAHMSIATAITAVFSSSVSVGTQVTNWTRRAKSAKSAVWTCLISFVVFNGLMILAGAWSATIYQQSDIVKILTIQGFSFLAILLLFLNMFTIQGPIIFNASTAMCNFFRTRHRRLMTLASSIIGIVLALIGANEYLVPFLQILGTLIPPIAGTIFADYWLTHKGRYPLLEDAKLPAFNYAGLAAYALGALAAFLSPWIAPIVGIVSSFVVYALLSKFVTAGRSLASSSR
ncbi:cytosine permease [Carnimonas bestiolae]|uniref:cytosine permease n=1 Tax=Carnimonas bestiolae TaxID=3402172 RepID=UPI003EDC0ED3